MYRVLLVAATAALAFAQETEAPRSTTLDSVEPELVRLMRAGIGTKSPNASIGRGVEAPSVFDGSYDWHSCVIAHWALLVHARVERDQELEAWLMDRLTRPALAREMERFAPEREFPDFFMPYVEGWFAMLLSELAKRPGRDDAELHLYREQVETDLFAWLEGNPLPENKPPPKDGGETWNGFYHSWLFGYLLLVLSDPVSEDAGDRLEALRRTKIEPRRADIEGLSQPHAFDFLWLPAVLRLIDRAQEESPSEMGPYTWTSPADLPDSVRVSTVHVVGREISRLWPLAADGAAGDPAAAELFRAHMSAYLERKDLWDGDFAAVSHWLPQFLWFGHWWSRGRP